MPPTLFDLHGVIATPDVRSPVRHIHHARDLYLTKRIPTPQHIHFRRQIDAADRHLPHAHAAPIDTR